MFSVNHHSKQGFCLSALHIFLLFFALKMPLNADVSSKSFFYRNQTVSALNLKKNSRLNGTWRLNQDLKKKSYLENNGRNPKDSLVFTFQGDGIAVTLHKDRDCGFAFMSVNGGIEKCYNLFDESLRGPKKYIVMENLGQGRHTLTIRPAGRRVSLSRGSAIRVCHITVMQLLKTDKVKPFDVGITVTGPEKQLMNPLIEIGIPMPKNEFVNGPISVTDTNGKTVSSFRKIQARYINGSASHVHVGFLAESTSRYTVHFNRDKSVASPAPVMLKKTGTGYTLSNGKLFLEIDANGLHCNNALQNLCYAGQYKDGEKIALKPGAKARLIRVDKTPLCTEVEIRLPLRQKGHFISYECRLAAASPVARVNVGLFNRTTKLLRAREKHIGFDVKSGTQMALTHKGRTLSPYGKTLDRGVTITATKKGMIFNNKPVKGLDLKFRGGRSMLTVTPFQPFLTTKLGEPVLKTQGAHVTMNYDDKQVVTYGTAVKAFYLAVGDHDRVDMIEKTIPLIDRDYLENKIGYPDVSVWDGFLLRFFSLMDKDLMRAWLHTHRFGEVNRHRINRRGKVHTGRLQSLDGTYLRTTIKNYYRASNNRIRKYSYVYGKEYGEHYYNYMDSENGFIRYRNFQKYEGPVWMAPSYSRECAPFYMYLLTGREKFRDFSLRGVELQLMYQFQSQDKLKRIKCNTIQGGKFIFRPHTDWNCFTFQQKNLDSYDSRLRYILQASEYLNVYDYTHDTRLPEESLHLLQGSSGDEFKDPVVGYYTFNQKGGKGAAREAGTTQNTFIQMFAMEALLQYTQSTGDKRFVRHIRQHADTYHRFLTAKPSQGLRAHYFAAKNKDRIRRGMKRKKARYDIFRVVDGIYAGTWSVPDYRSPVKPSGYIYTVTKDPKYLYTIALCHYWEEKYNFRAPDLGGPAQYMAGLARQLDFNFTPMLARLVYYLYPFAEKDRKSAYIRKFFWKLVQDDVYNNNKKIALMAREYTDYLRKRGLIETKDAEDINKKVALILNSADRPDRKEADFENPREVSLWSYNNSKQKALALSLSDRYHRSGKWSLQVKVNSLPSKQYASLFRNCGAIDLSEVKEISFSVLSPEKSLSASNFWVYMRGHRYRGPATIARGKWTELRFVFNRNTNKGKSLGKLRIYFNRKSQFKPGMVFYMDDFAIKTRSK